MKKKTMKQKSIKNFVAETNLAYEMHLRSLKKAKQSKDSLIFLHVFFIIAATMMFLDMFTTILALTMIPGVYEVNLFHRHFSSGNLGPTYFLIATPLEIAFIYFVARGIDIVSFEVVRFKKTKVLFPGISKYYHVPAYVWLIGIAVIFGSVVTDNMGVIIHGIRF